MSFFRRKESPAIPPPNDPQQGNRLQRAPPQDRYGSPAPGGYGQPQAGYGGGQDRYGSPAPDRYGAAPDRYGAAPDRYGAAPDRYGAPAPTPAPAPGRYGGQQQPDRYGASPAPAPDRYGGGQQLQQSGGYGQQQPDRYARASPAPDTSRLRQGPTAGDPYSHRPDANVDADRAALFAGYNPEGPRRLQRDDQRQAPTEADWDRRRAEGADEEEDVEAIKQSIRTTKQESLASTRNALRIAREAEETAANTLLKLGDQSEKLGDAERHIDVAKYNSMKAEDKVDELKQLNKSIFRPVIVFNKDKKRAAQEAKMLARHEEERDERERNAYEVRESQNRIGNAYSAGRQNSYGSAGGPAGGSGDQYGEEGVGAPQRGGYGSYRTQEQQNVRKAQRSRYQFEATGSDDEIEDELDDNLDGIGDAVGRMKSLALAMGQEVDRQNDRLTKFEKKTDDVDVAVVRNTNRLKKY